MCHYKVSCVEWQEIFPLRKLSTVLGHALHRAVHFLYERSEGVKGNRCVLHGRTATRATVRRMGSSCNGVVDNR